VYLANLKIAGFRNLDSASLELAPSRNLLFGPNGSGKSNVLEAIHYLCTARSFRGATDDLMVKSDANLLRIVGEARMEGRIVKVELAYQRHGKKRLKIDDVVQPKLGALYELLKVVFFGPDDVELIYGPPSTRRRFLDLSIAQLQVGYIALLWEYKKVVAQRNALLKELGEAYDSLGAVDGEESLAAWDERLITLALRINSYRAEFVSEASDISAGLHRKLTATDDKFEIRYKASPSLETYSAEAYQRKLESRRARELLMGQSMYGPHRDDIEFLLSGTECRGFASRGQVKSMVLAVKLGVVELIRTHCGESPILLLDEVYSDLDRNRLDLLISLLDDLGQVVITTSKLGEVTDLDAFENLLRILNGSISKYTS
jgi:DNA replication and repair protein RecF